MRSTQTLPPIEQWGKILMVVAHPDDEVLACGGHFDLVRPFLFHVTTGALINDPAEVSSMRQRELNQALHLAGIPLTHCLSSNVPDQRAAHSLPHIYTELCKAIAALQPDCILTHPYEGGHPDHDATALVCSLAAAVHQIPIVEFTSYHNGTPHSDVASWCTGEFLASTTPVSELRLSARQSLFKRQLLAEFQSQKEVLDRFDIDVESFRIAPQYSFDAPPHLGLLLYESFQWGWTFKNWRNLVSMGIAAIRES